MDIMKKGLLIFGLVASQVCQADIGIIRNVQFGMTMKQVKETVQTVCSDYGETHGKARDQDYAGCMRYGYSLMYADAYFIFSEKKLDLVVLKYPNGNFSEMVNAVAKNHRLLSLSVRDDVYPPERKASFQDGIFIYADLNKETGNPEVALHYSTEKNSISYGSTTYGDGY